MRRTADAVELGGPVALVLLTALFGTTVSLATETYVINALVAVGIVVALYVFIGSSGVLSFGHISFVAVGSWAAGVLTVPDAEKPARFGITAGFSATGTVSTPATHAPTATKLMWPNETTPELPMKT